MKPLDRIEEHSNERVGSFFVDCKGPEEVAGNLLREWAVKNLSDYTARRCVGCAPKGHHPKGEEHQPNEEVGSHEYVMQMFLFGDEGNEETFLGADVCDAPKGLFLVGDVALNEFHDDGNIDIGSSMQIAFGVMTECLKDMGGYEFDFQNRRHMEEQIFSIINKYTLPYTFTNAISSGLFISKYKQDKIYLWYTGEFGIGGGQLPLIIKLRKNDNGIDLLCRFGFTLSHIIIISIFIAIAWIGMLGTTISNPNYDLEGKLIVISIVLIWSLLGFIQFPLGNKLMFNKKQKAVIEFLETRLGAKKA
jgi:hypothetical protein